MRCWSYLPYRETVMATRLMSRWARLLGSRGPQLIASCQARLAGHPIPFLAVAHAEPLWARALNLHPQARTLCGRHSLSTWEEENLTVPRRTELDELVEKASSPREVLQLWAERDANANETALCVIQLARMVLEKGDSKHSDLLQDPRLQTMLDQVSSEVRKVWNGSLVGLLRALTSLGVAPGTPVLASLQTEALWRVRRFSYRQLVYLYEWACGRGAPQAEELLGAVVKQLELRWTELADARTVAALMARPAHLPPSLLDRLEDKALELVERFRAEDIRKVAVALASQGRRSVALFRALSYHIQQKPSEELKASLLLDLVFAYAKVNFHHSQVFQRIAGDLVPQVPRLTPGDVTRCARSFSHLKWLHHSLFEGFAEHYTQQWQKYSTLQLCSLLLSLAQLNFQPSKKEQFYGQVHAALEGALSDLEPFLLTDLVWSLCVLQQARPDHLRAVLDPAVQLRLAGGAPSRVASYGLKLQHIASTAQLEVLCPPGVVPDPPSTLDGQPTPLQSSLHEALRALAGGLEGGYRAGVVTVFGWTIDGELVLDSDNKPINLLGLKAPHLPGGGGGSPLPRGAHRIAFLASEFSHHGSKGRELLGRYAMRQRHLQLAGFLTVPVLYYEWAELKDDRQRMAYLKDKMGKAVAEDMAK
ncbi:FAST kinase domain-containing protein 4 [Paramormyrops kingsleyae]|uniref:FAST kinase domain-containing protein 4 n=1 Tax=Paramormyrops kingsleyae TaxID=1676925 RepID=A0A3B3QI35_9TELE|nr:FAST kinase domain-containing protein 4 [Paramormyrops kingsleyae]